MQTRAPAGPRQTPAQQSSSATQGAPNGAQLLAQVSVPVVSGRQRWPQHCVGTAQGSPSGRQVAPADGPRHRSVPFGSARQLSAPPAQQSGDFAQRSPMARHPFGIGGRRHRAGRGSAAGDAVGRGHAGPGAAVLVGRAPLLIRAAAGAGGAARGAGRRRLAAPRAAILVGGAELEGRMTAGEGVAAAGGVGPTHAGAAAAVGCRAAGLPGDPAKGKQLAGGLAALARGDAELAAAVGVGGARLARGAAAGGGRGAGAGHAGACATVAVDEAAAAGRRAGRFAADAVHAAERATITRSRARLRVGHAADRVETDEIAAARRIDAAQERATVGVAQAGGPVAVAHRERRAASGGAEARTTVGWTAAGAAVGGAVGDRTGERRRQLDVPPAAEERPRQREQENDPGPDRRPQGCAPVPASRRAVATRRPPGNVAR